MPAAGEDRERLLQGRSERTCHRRRESYRRGGMGLRECRPQLATVMAPVCNPATWGGNSPATGEEYHYSGEGAVVVLWHV